MCNAATPKSMATVSTSSLAKTNADPIEVTLEDEAASTINALSETTGESVESLLETSIALLKIVADSERTKRRVVVTTRFLWPIEELTVSRR
jgi:S1-C subfamily serine protease